MTLDIVGWLAAFVAGAALGAAPWLVRRLRGRGAADGGREPSRGRVWPVVVVTACVTLLVATAMAWLGLRLLLRPEPPRVATVADAVKAFRSGGCPEPTAASVPAASAFGPPPAGVYTYRSTGRFVLQAPLFGREERALPATVPVTVLVDGDRWSWVVRFFEQRVETFEFVTGPGRRLDGRRDVTDDVHFRIPVRATMSCDPGVVLPADAEPGAAWEQGCISHTDFGLGTTHELPTKARLVGLETVTVEADRIPAYHVRFDVAVGGGDQTGGIARDVWYSAVDGLPLRYVLSSRTGGMAENLEEYTLELASTRPRR